MSGSNRIHYSTDGASVWSWDYTYNTITAHTSTDKQILDGTPYTTNQLSTDKPGIIIGFPKTIKIDGLSSTVSNGNTQMLFDAWVSTDSTTGLDGTWTQIVDSNVTFEQPYLYNAHAITSPINCNWLRVKISNYFQAGNIGWRSLHVFGEYQSPRFEFWNAAGDTELTDAYPLPLPDAPNSSDYSQYFGFKLKNTNTDSATHSYSLTVSTVKYGGDSVVSNYFKLSTNFGSTKLSTITVSSLTNGSLSTELRVYADVTGANNPGDGLHQFVVDVTES